MDIKSSAHALLGIINDILDFSKIESGKMEIVPAEYEFNSMLNDLYNMFSPLMCRGSETMRVWFSILWCGIRALELRKRIFLDALDATGKDTQQYIAIRTCREEIRLSRGKERNELLLGGF